MSKSEIKLQALKLRRQGASVKEISDKLNVSKSIASLWTRDMKLTNAQRLALNARMIAGGHRGRMLGAAMNKEKKMKKLESAKLEAGRKISSLTKVSLFFLGLGLYWGEGTKSMMSALAVANSDPHVIQLTMRWFVECFGVEKDRFHPRIFINSTHRARESVLLEFWSHKLGLPQSQFAKTIFIERQNKKVYENHDTYYGVLALRVRKGTDLRYRILALIKRVSEPAICRGQ